MDDDPLQIVWSVLPILCTIAVLVALIILWRARHSLWLIAAMVGSVLDLLLYVQRMIVPGLYQVLPYLFLVGQLSTLLFAVGLLGYALETKKR